MMMNALGTSGTRVCSAGRTALPLAAPRRHLTAQRRQPAPRCQAAAVDVVAESSPSETTSPASFLPSYATPDPTTLKYAIVEIGGTQLIVEEGRYYTCNRLKADPGCTIQLGRVLAVKESGKLHLGAPWLETAVVQAQVLEELRDKKVVVFKMNRKKHYRRKNGHRQPLTKFLITQITPGAVPA